MVNNFTDGFIVFPAYKFLKVYIPNFIILKIGHRQICTGTNNRASSIFQGISVDGMYG